jgi:tetratricopeptide (TPR) repeat protein
MHEIGQVMYRRFLGEYHAENPRMDEIDRLLKEASKYAHEALHILPPTHPLGSHIHHLLGNINDDTGQPSIAIKHYVKSIQIADACNDLGGSSKGRREVARAYLKMGQLENALEYALAAVEYLETKTGSSVAAGDMAAAQSLVEMIQFEIRARGSGKTAQPARTQ